MNIEAAPDDADEFRPANQPWRRHLAQLGRPFTHLPTKKRVVVVGLLMFVEVAVGWRIGPHAALPAFLVFGAVGWLVALSDTSERRIPNAALMIAYPIIGGLLVEASSMSGHWQNLLRAALAGAALGAFYLALALWRPGELGLGDCKFAPLVGLALGWLSWSAVIEGALFGFLGAVLWFLPRALLHRVSRSTQVAFGPFMVIGALVAILLT